MSNLLSITVDHNGRRCEASIDIDKSSASPIETRIDAMLVNAKKTILRQLAEASAGNQQVGA